MSFVYRVLREDEIIDKGLGYGLYSKIFDDKNDYNLGHALDNISSHIENEKETEFISCSTDFSVDLLNYALNQLDLRPYLAVISNHDRTTVISDKFKELIMSLEKIHELELNGDYNYKNEKIKLKNQIRNISQKEIDKFVLDASYDIYTNELYKFFILNGLIKNNNKFINNIAKKDSEVLVLNYIKKDDIIILSPLQYDILYSLIKSNSLSVIDFKTLLMLSIFKESNYERIKNYLSDDVEKNLFIEMYCKRKSIYNIIKNEKYFKMTLLYKKLIIKNCIDYLNEIKHTSFNSDYIYTLEDNIDLYNNDFVEVKEGKILKKEL